MHKIFMVFICCIAILLKCTGQYKVRIKDKDFEKFVDKITQKEIPNKCKIPNKINCFRNQINPAYVLTLEESKKYLGYSDNDYFITIFDYDMDEDRVSNLRQIENPPFADNKIIRDKYVIIIYGRCSNCHDLLVSDTISEILTTFTLEGIFIDKITIRGQYTRESDWIDFVYLSNNKFRIFQYLPNLKNYNIKGETYYVIDENLPQTIVEINDYQIDENGKINLVKTYPRQYLKEDVSYYRSYHANSDDPMNEYDF